VLALVFLLLISILTHAVLPGTLANVGSQESISDADSMALAVDSALNDGLQAIFPNNFSIEQGCLHMYDNGKLIEIGGIFEQDDSEPV
jgi:hypothetical protein